MSETLVSELADRGVVSVAGEDARKLLQGIVTNDIDSLETRPALFAGLLSPQGKILFEFFVVKAPDGGLLLDVDRTKAADLVKRLTLYRLRARAAIVDASDAYRALASWGLGTELQGDAPGIVAFADPRLEHLGVRILASRAANVAVEPNADPAAYHAHRIAIGAPEGGKDYEFGDTFPHEALFDQLNGVSFEKGCYVGQEIVARMQHRGTARKRIVPVNSKAPLPVSGTPILAGEVEIGRLGSVAEPERRRGLALIRLDRAHEFAARGVVLTAGGEAIAIDIPAWARLDLAKEPSASP